MNNLAIHLPPIQLAQRQNRRQFHLGPPAEQGLAHTWPVQSFSATSSQRTRMALNSTAESAPLPTIAAFSFQRPGLVVPTIAVVTPGQDKVKRSASPIAWASGR